MNARLILGFPANVAAAQAMPELFSADDRDSVRAQPTTSAI